MENLIKVETIQDEVDDNYSNDDVFNITSWGADLSFRELISMYDEDELLKPELQRNYVWDKKEASRFIESILLGLPIPSIFLANMPDNTKLIIDGYQRIMSVYDFVQTGIFSKDNKSFNLSNTDLINERWKGKTFKELSKEEQRKIRSTTIHAIIFEQKVTKNKKQTSLFQIFERINTSGRTLNPQEVRNCVYQGEFNKVLFDLNKYDKWRELYGSKEEDNRMRDLEFVLRFFAMSDFNFKEKETGQISLKKYLNEYMGACQESSLDNKSKDFKETIDFIYKNLGKNAFNNINVKKDFIERFHPTIFDAITTATSLGLKNHALHTLPIVNIKQKQIQLLEDEIFKDAISQRTTNIEKIKARISLAGYYLYNINLDI